MSESERIRLCVARRERRLIEALGVELTIAERRLVSWMAGSLVNHEAETLAALFERARNVSADVWADDTRWEPVEGDFQASDTPQELVE